MAQDPMSLLKLVTHYTEMPEVDQLFAIESATNALRAQEKSETTMYFKDLAELVKKDFDATKGGSWHVIAGHEFGSFMSHEQKTVIHFSLDKISFLIWKHG